VRGKVIVAVTVASTSFPEDLLEARQDALAILDVGRDDLLVGKRRTGRHAAIRDREPGPRSTGRRFVIQCTPGLGFSARLAPVRALQGMGILDAPHDTFFGLLFQRPGVAADWLRSVLPPRVVRAIA
jgi:hypothetical protein